MNASPADFKCEPLQLGVHNAVKELELSSARVGTAVESIADALREQTAASTDIAQRVESIAQGIDQNHMASTESSRRSDALVELSRELKVSISSFKT